MDDVSPQAGETLAKCATGIQGFDELTLGGLPRGRAALVCGGPGCGKTLFGVEFLVRGAAELGEPGVFMAFEESPEELAKNVASLGWDLDRLQAEGKLVVDHVTVERSEIVETGEYDLDGLFIRLGLAIDSVGAKRVVLDTVESLFATLPNEFILRSELRRLFRWLKNKGVTAVITGEQGEKMLTRHGLEEYVSDCVVFLDNRVSDDITTRRMRIVKYRGSLHGTNSYPFLIDDTGISVLPITSLKLDYATSSERVSTGVERLDAMLGGQGYYKGSSVLVSGTAGTGKTSLAASFAAALCARGGRCLYFAFEESVSQIVRNMRSIGIDLERYERDARLKIHAARPTANGLELHLLTMHKLVSDVRPDAVVIDPVSNFVTVGTAGEVKSVLTRFVDFLKAQQITSVFTDLTSDMPNIEHTNVGISSLMDTWLLLRNLEQSGERNRGLFVLKSRGMAHSNQVREFRLGDGGIQLADVYVGSEGVLMGTARAAQVARAQAAATGRQQEMERAERALRRKRALVEAQIASLREELAADEDQTRRLAAELASQVETEDRSRDEMARLRGADGTETTPAGR
ncbi:MAG: circadian clock protein KaiC [Deltaproteobacteria bacterium]|nr:circadian clock protein KaiC [Deltaproteobacteria bacterium]